MKNEEKLKYILDKLKIKTKDIAKKMGVSNALISQLKSTNEKTTPLRNIHIYGICSAYNIPIEIFKDKRVDTIEKIETLLQRQPKSNSKSIFDENSELMEKLVGDWYLYSYPSTPQLAEVWETKTMFYADGTVEDEHNNRGVLHIGKNQSVILKESNGSKNITTITFDNARVHYNIFIFSRVSKSNSVNKEMFNFGICSRQKLDMALVKEMLGEIDEVQLQMNYAMLDRVGECIKIGRE